MMSQKWDTKWDTDIAFKFFQLKQLDKRIYGGEGGIRTHGTLARTPVFKTGAFNHSATSPVVSGQKLSVCDIRHMISRANENGEAGFSDLPV